MSRTLPGAVEGSFEVVHDADEAPGAPGLVGWWAIIRDLAEAERRRLQHEDLRLRCRGCGRDFEERWYVNRQAEEEARELFCWACRHRNGRGGGPYTWGGYAGLGKHLTDAERRAVLDAFRAVDILRKEANAQGGGGRG